MNPLDEVFGSTPEVANYIPTIFGDEQIKALEANIAAFPDISKLGNLYYDYMMGSFNKAIPGFSDILATGGNLTKQMQSTAAEELQGKIPQDVQEQVQRSSAFQNLLSGGGGGMASANTARNYGLTSLNLINQGAQLAGEAGNAAQRWAGLASGMIMSPSGMLVTPQQQAALTMQNNLYKQQTQQLKYNLAAAPNPQAKGISDTIINLVGAYLGAGRGGSGGTAPNAWSNTFGGSNASQGTGGQNAAFSPFNDTSGSPKSVGADTPSVFGSQPYQSNIAANPFSTYTPLTMGSNQSTANDILQLQPTGTSDFWGTG